MLPEGLQKRIHVVGQHVRTNKKHGLNLPCYTVKYRGGTWHCEGFLTDVVAVRGRSDFAKPLASGAVVWLETTARMTLFNARRPTT